MKHTAIASIALVLALSACGETSSSQGNPPSAVSEVTTPRIALKKAGKSAGVDFTLTAVKLTDQIGPAGMGPKTEAGETFVVVDYTLKNTGAQPLPLLERPSLSLVDGKGQTYVPDESATLMAGV